MKAVKSTLAQFSKGSAALNIVYGDALQRIEGQLGGDCDRAKIVLSWITFAKRPLTTAEICCALAVEIGEVELDPENIDDVEDLVSVCAGLVVVDQESNIIRLAHHTAQEYFERTVERWNPSAQLDIASVCLIYLSLGTFRSGSCSTDKEFEERLQQSKFLEYAAKYWGQHTLTVQDEVCELACSFLLHGGLVSCATQVMSVPESRYRNYSQEYPKGSTSLHITAQFGLLDLSQKLILRLGSETAIAVNAKDSRDQTPLLLAAKYGHSEIAKLLVDKGAEINAHGVPFINALQAASARGHEQVVKLLLDKGAEINAQIRPFGNALYAASYRGHEQMIKPLVDKGADINAQGGPFGNALQAASVGGNEQMVKLLLDKGAEVNAQGEEYSNALKAALAEGHEQIVKPLLEVIDTKAASVGAPTDSGYASQSRVEGIVSQIERNETLDLNKDEGGIEHLPDNDIGSVDSDLVDIRSENSQETTPVENQGKAHLARFLAYDQELGPLCGKVLNRIGRARFTNAFRKLLKSFYRSLLPDAATEREQISVHLLQSRQGRLRISRTITNHFDPDEDEDTGKMRSLAEQAQTRAEFLNNWIEKVPRLNPSTTVRQQPDPPRAESNVQEDQEYSYDYSSSEDGDSEVEHEEAELPHLAEMEMFFRNSRSFQMLLNGVRKLLLPRLVRQIVESIPRDQIWFSKQQNQSVVNKTMAFIEEYTQLEWDWWPLEPRMRLLRDDETRLFWQCVSLIVS